MDLKPFPDENMMPMGMAMSLAMNTSAMHAFAELSPEAQDEMLSRARQAKSKSEMEEIVNELPHFTN